MEIKLVQMSIEIEKKFLISSTDFKKDAFKKSYIKQGFLNSNKNRVVRIRIIDEQGFITVKGISFDGGTSRFEWEKEIPKSEAEQLFLLCEKEVIEKIRYFVKTRCQSEINQNLKISSHETPTLHYLLVIFSTEKYLITFL